MWRLSYLIYHYSISKGLGVLELYISRSPSHRVNNLLSKDLITSKSLKAMQISCVSSNHNLCYI